MIIKNYIKKLRLLAMTTIISSFALAGCTVYADNQDTKVATDCSVGLGLDYIAVDSIENNYDSDVIFSKTYDARVDLNTNQVEVKFYNPNLQIVIPSGETVTKDMQNQDIEIAPSRAFTAEFLGTLAFKIQVGEDALNTKYAVGWGENQGYTSLDIDPNQIVKYGLGYQREDNSEDCPGVYRYKNGKEEEFLKYSINIVVDSDGKVGINEVEIP